MNGWTNRETWLVNLWFDWLLTTPSNLEQLRDDFEKYIETVFPLNGGFDGFFKDFINLDLINWNELEEAVKENMEEE